MVKDHYTAICYKCNTTIEWIKGLGWTHVTAVNCSNPVPIKDTIK